MMIDRKTLFNILAGLHKQDHGYVANGPDDAQRCECDECYEAYLYNSALDDVAEEVKKKGEKNGGDSHGNAGELI